MLGIPERFTAYRQLNTTGDEPEMVHGAINPVSDVESRVVIDSPVSVPCGLARGRETDNATGFFQIHSEQDGQRAAVRLDVESHPTNSLIGSPSLKIGSGRWAWS